MAYEIRKKFESKTKRGIFVGYNENKTYRISETKNIVCDCDVRFNEKKDGLDLLNCVKKRKNENSNQNNLIVIELNPKEKEDEEYNVTKMKEKEMK